LVSVLLILACTLGAFPSIGDAQACSIGYWVSTGGNDDAAGSAAAPFLTIDRARRAARQNSRRGQCTILVNIESGTYALTQPLMFDYLDSGSAQAKVVYRAAPGNSLPVFISGGLPVTGFTCNNLNVCTATVPALPDGILPRQFYVNGQRAVRARTNVGQVVNLNYIRQPDGYSQIIPQTLTHPELVEAVTVTQWKMMRCRVESMVGTMLTMQNPCWDNANTSRSPWNFQLLSWLENAPEFLSAPNMWYLDPYLKQLTYFNTGLAPPTYAVLPTLETLVALNGSPGRPVTNIVFKGLRFAYATWLGPNTNDGYVTDQSGELLEGTGYLPNIIGHEPVVYRTPGNVSLQLAHNITFDGNTFIHLGAVALDLGAGSQDNTVINNVFTDISSAAIQVGGVGQSDMRPDRAHKTSNNVIRNNLISYTGRDYYDSAGIFVGFTTGTVINHNTISHTPWTSVAIGWGWGLFDKGSFPGLPGAVPNMWGVYSTPTTASRNEISSNEFDNFLEQLWDGGAIYTNGAQGPNFANGLTIKLNVAQNKRPAGGSNIYYTDGGSQYVTMDQNVSLNDPVGIADFGPCLTGSSIPDFCALTGTPYGSDVGGCLPVGDLTYMGNYFLDPIDFFGPQICQNDYIPPFPVDLTFVNNVATNTAAQVPNWILLQAGAHGVH